MSDRHLELMAELITEVKTLRESVERGGAYDGPLTRGQAARYLGVHPDTLYEWSKKGLVAYSKLGDGEKAPMRFYREDLDEFARNRRRVPTSQEAFSNMS